MCLLGQQRIRYKTLFSWMIIFQNSRSFSYTVIYRKRAHRRLKSLPQNSRGRNWLRELNLRFKQYPDSGHRERRCSSRCGVQSSWHMLSFSHSKMCGLGYLIPTSCSQWRWIDVSRQWFTPLFLDTCLRMVKMPPDCSPYCLYRDST